MRKDGTLAIAVAKMQEDSRVAKRSFMVGECLQEVPDGMLHVAI